MWALLKNKPMYIQDRDRLTDIENELVKREGLMNRCVLVSSSKIHNAMAG